MSAGILLFCPVTIPIIAVVIIQKGTVMVAVGASGGETGNWTIISVLISSRDSSSILCFLDPILRIILTIGFGKWQSLPFFSILHSNGIGDQTCRIIVV